MMQRDQVRTSAIVADRVFDGTSWHDNAAVMTDDGRIAAVLRASELPADLPRQTCPPGSIVAPGFIDLQVNGGGGILLNDAPTAEAMRQIARAHRRYGTTGCLPTLITDTRAQTQAAIAAGRAAAGRDGIIGLHLEGPFISPQRPGVHRPDLIARAERADLDWLLELRHVGASMVTLAPEQVPPGFVRALTDAGLHVSAGHSEATSEELAGAIADGLRSVTHLFNAMPPLAGRAPGIVGTALAEPRLVAGLIVDGVHVDPIAIRAAFAAKGARGIALVTDAMPTVGSILQSFTLMGRVIRLVDGRLSTEQGTLAGAHLDMASAVRNAVCLAGIPLEDALRAASLTPAQFLGLGHERGSLVPGARADLVVMTKDLQVTETFVDGRADEPERD
jgi:N-acetylglucosamine-6-phosphate deacetylase